MLAIDFSNLDDRDIKRTATEVVDRYRAISFRLIHTIGQRCRRWLIDNALNL